MRIIKLIVAVIMSLVIIVISSMFPAFAVVSDDLELVSSVSQGTWQNSYFNSILGFDKNAMRDYNYYSEFVSYSSPATSNKYDFSAYDMDNLNSFFIYNIEEKFGYIAFFDNDVNYIPPSGSNGYYQIGFKNCHCVFSYVVNCSTKSFPYRDYFDSASNVYSRSFFSHNEDFLRNSIIISDECLSSVSLPCIDSYYSNNICHQFIEWLKSDNDDTFTDVDNVSGNYIKYYDGQHSYYADGGFEPYGKGNIKNFLNSSVVFEDDIYYMSDVDKVDNSIKYQHNEIIEIYIKGNQEFQDYFKNKYGGSQSDSWLLDKTKNETEYILNYLDTHTLCKHYKGDITFSMWIDEVASGKIYVDNSINSDIHYIHFRLANSYSWTGSGFDSGVFSGHRVDTNAKLIQYGADGINGIGSNLADADDNNVPSKSDLLYKGWNNGFPNQNGNYPYCITVNRNGKPYIKLYMKSKPEVSSYYYSDNQIKYTIQMKNIEGYIYFPDYNVSKSFSFPDIQKISNKELKAVVNGFAVGASIASLATGNIAVEVVAVIFDVCSMLADLGADYYTICDYQFILWTNYIGSKSSYNGFILTFNWDVGVDGAFKRDNSDDEYNYSDDYVQDKPSTEQATDSNGTLITGNNYYYTYNYYYSDNNGNVHGGGDITYVPTEPPTASNIVSYDYGSYNFTSDLANNSVGFFDFIRSALSFMPWWVYASVGASIAVMIALRILGR